MMRREPPILFLDIDGVLIAFPEGEPTAHQFTPRCVAELKTVIAALPGLRVVFSTSWRLGKHVNRLQDQWLANGLPVEITRDGTPELQPDPTVPRFHLRGRGIQAWLENHPEITRWAVIDDDRWAIEPILQADRCVFTDASRGMEEKHSRAIIDILR
jgi:hypothetical protein